MPILFVPVLVIVSLGFAALRHLSEREKKKDGE